QPNWAAEPVRLPCRHEDIVATLPFYNSVSNATALFRRDALEDSVYDADFLHAEDYEFWSRLARRDLHFANTGRVHLSRRTHPQSVSHANPLTQKRNSDRVRASWRESLALPTEGPWARAHFELGHSSYEGDLGSLRLA